MDKFQSLIGKMEVMPNPAIVAGERQSKVLRSVMSGDATWRALHEAVAELKRVAPQDCDVLIQVGDVSVLKARFIEPHAFLFEGFNEAGHHTGIVIHFSQLAARVIYRPKHTPSRVVTMFHNEPSA